MWMCSNSFYLYFCSSNSSSCLHVMRCLDFGSWTLWFAKLCSNIISFLQASLLFDFNLWPQLVGPTINLDKETQILKKCYQNRKIDFNNTNKFGFCESQCLCLFSLVAVNLKVRFSENERFSLNKERESVELKLKFFSFFFSLLFFFLLFPLDFKFVRKKLVQWRYHSYRCVFLVGLVAFIREREREREWRGSFFFFFDVFFGVVFGHRFCGLRFLLLLFDSYASYPFLKIQSFSCFWLSFMNLWVVLQILGSGFSRVWRVWLSLSLKLGVEETYSGCWRKQNKFNLFVCPCWFLR